MNYRKDKNGNDLSLLGFGCMRFQKKMGRINMELCEKQIMNAYNNGVNYFDTAFIYPGSESAIGEVFEKNNIRENIYIATKLPPQLMVNIDVLEKLFKEQLKRLRTDYIDFYLMHMMSDIKVWERLKGIGIEQWIADKKASGQIRNIGFSYHGNTEKFCEIIDAYDWDMTLIQYNYLDEHSQAGRKGLEYAHSKGIPVMIMEPLRGGKLVNNLPDEAKELFKNHEVQHTPAQWAFKWLFSQEEVTTVLSGMNSEEMVVDNINTASTTKIREITESDEKMLKAVVRAINHKMKVGCTGCGYCMPCPQNINISGTFSAYNTHFTGNKFLGFKEYLRATAFSGSSPASQCINCGKCESHCPQAIEIRKELKNAVNTLETPVYKTANNVIKKFSSKK